MPTKNFDEIIKLAQTADELERMKNQADRFSVYIDNFNDKIDLLIRKQFHPDNYDRLYKMICDYKNLLKKIVNLKSVIYKKEAVRKWMRGEGDNRKADENYEELIQNSNISIAYQTLNKYININNTGFMRVMPDLQNNKIKYEAVPSENIVIKRNEDDIFTFDAILHKIVIDSSTSFFYYWDKEVYGKVDREGKEFTALYDEKPNPYIDPNTKEGIIPYVPFWAMQPLANSFWNETINDDLYQATLQINVHLTHINNLIKQASYKQIALTGLIQEDVKAMYNHVTDSLNPVCLKGENADIKAIQVVIELRETMEAIHTLAAGVMDQHGVEFASQIVSAQRQTAEAIQLQKDAMNDLREEQYPLLRDGEKKVAFYSAIIANEDLGSSIDVNGEFEETFGEDEAEWSIDEMAYQDWLTFNGYRSKKDTFMQLNPDIPEDQVEKVMQENIAFNKSMEGTAGPGATEIDEAFQTQQAENTEVVPGG